MKTNELIAQIRAIASPEDMERVSALIRSMPGKMAPQVQSALLEKMAEVNAQSKAALEETITETSSVLRLHGVEYPLTDWLTPANYARKFELKNPMVVTNWIARGIIPAENVKEIPELGIRLVKAIEYSPRKYDQRAQDKDA